MSSRPEKKKACSAPLKSEKRPYDNRPRPGTGTARQPATGNAEPVRVILPGQPPALTPEVARVLLRILIKARDQIADTDVGNRNPDGGAQ